MVSSPLQNGVAMRHDGVVIHHQEEEGEDHDQDYDDWTGFGKARVACGVLRRTGQGGQEADAQAWLGAGVFREPGAVSGGDGGLRGVPLLGSGAGSAGF